MKHLPQSSPARQKITPLALLGFKQRREQITMLTAYDYSMARLFDAAGVDVLLVGDSAANVVAGHETTLPITLDEMIYHARAVVRGTSRAMVVIDLPFGSYQEGPQQAVRSALRVMKESHAQAVKLEGGREQEESIAAILRAGIPVMGHIGLMPQSIHQLDIKEVRGQQDEEAQRILEDAVRLEKIGCFALVFEKVKAGLTKEACKRLKKAPIIGIGAGVADGQVLVSYDMLGITDIKLRFVKRYADLATTMDEAVKQYIQEVKTCAFPTDKHAY